MRLNVVFILVLYLLEVKSISVQFEDVHSNKDILEINDSLMKVYYKSDGRPGPNHSDESYSHSDESHSDESQEENPDDEEPFDSWSLIWYIASFGGLIAFFLVVSCSEWCCRKHVREQQATRGLASSPPPSPTAESPPPAYDHFAPPSYDSLNYPGATEKTEYDVYVVPVHAIDSLVDTNSRRQGEEPPNYSSVNEQHTNS